MALSDYFKGPKHRATATRLEAELQSHRLQSNRDQEVLQAKHDELVAVRLQSQKDQEVLQAKYDELVAHNRALGLFDLLAVQDQIRAEQALLANTRAQNATKEAELAAAQQALLANTRALSPRTRRTWPLHSGSFKNSRHKFSALRMLSSWSHSPSMSLSSSSRTVLSTKRDWTKTAKTKRGQLVA